MKLVIFHVFAKSILIHRFPKFATLFSDVNLNFYKYFVCRSRNSMTLSSGMLFLGHMFVYESSLLIFELSLALLLPSI